MAQRSRREIVRIIESETGRCIHLHEMPKERKTAYYNPQLKIKTKADGPQHRVSGTIGGNQIHYPGETAAYTENLETMRILLNAVVSEGANFFESWHQEFLFRHPIGPQKIHAHQYQTYSCRYPSAKQHGANDYNLSS